MFLKICEALGIHPDDIVLRGDVENLCVTLKNEIPKLILILNPEKKGFCKGIPLKSRIYRLLTFIG